MRATLVTMLLQVGCASGEDAMVTVEQDGSTFPVDAAALTADAIDAGGDAEPSALRAVLARLRECDLLTEGEVNFRRFYRVDDEGELADCANQCWMEADCDQLAGQVCGHGSVVDACLDDCIRAHVELFECDEGATRIEPGRVCDGDDDCDDRSDESDCDGVDFFECQGEGRTLTSNLCDGVPHCDDGSDESDCPDDTIYDCNMGWVLPRSFVCDLHEDCPDGSDEEGCATLVCE